MIFLSFQWFFILGFQRWNFQIFSSMLHQHAFRMHLLQNYNTMQHYFSVVFFSLCDFPLSEFGVSLFRHCTIEDMFFSIVTTESIQVKVYCLGYQNFRQVSHKSVAHFFCSCSPFDFCYSLTIKCVSCFFKSSLNNKLEAQP